MKPTSPVVVLTEKHWMLLEFIRKEPRTFKSMMTFMKKSHRETFMKNWLAPLKKAGLIELTIPNKPNSPGQKYRLVTRNDTEP